MSGFIKKKANALLKKLDRDISVPNLIRYIKSSGYRVVYFNTPDGDELVSLLNLEKTAESHQAFLFSNPEFKILFIDNNTREQEQNILLLHELGHIELGHIVLDGNLDGAKYQFEANAFAGCILDKSKKPSPKAVLSVLLILSALLISLCTVLYANAEKSSNFNVAVTQFGEKYHRGGCICIKNSKISVIPLKEAKKDRSPCSVCNPTEEK